jgi:hypothetical protein
MELLPFCILILVLSSVIIVVLLNASWMREKQRFNRPVSIVFKYDNATGNLEDLIGAESIVVFNTDGDWKSILKHEPDRKNAGTYYIDGNTLVLLERGYTSIFNMNYEDKKFMQFNKLNSADNSASGIFDIFN